MDQRGDRMRKYWDDRARENAAWYVDTSLDYDDPDMDTFFETGRKVVDEALLSAPLQPDRRDVALEIGPGIGRISAALAEHFSKVIGVDVSEEMVAKARGLVTDPRVEFIVGDGVSLRPVEDDSVDFVTTFTVLQHMPSKELVLGYLADAARVLRPGGVLAAQWNNLPHPTAWQWRARWWRLRSKLGLGMRGEQRNAPEFVGTRVQWNDVEAALEANGLQVKGRKGEGTLFSWVWAQK